VNQEVMDEVGVLPEPDILLEETKEGDAEEPEVSDIFTDFVDTLDFEDFDE
jgi:hypothetical protein